MDRTEQDLLKSDRRLRHNRDLIVNLGYEKEELRKEVKEEEIQIDKLSEILALIDMWVCWERRPCSWSNDYVYV